MRRGFALSVATAAWIIVVQFMSGAVAPAPVYDLTDVGVRGLLLRNADIPATPASSKSTRQFPPRGLRVPLNYQSASNSSVYPTTTTTPATTTSAPAAATTTAPVATTTTSAPATTTTSPPSTTTPTTTAPTTTTVAVTGSFSAAAETDFASRINGLRASVGVPLLAGNADLNNYARWWAKYMAESDNFTHSNIGSLLGEWSIVGENLGYGPSVQSIFQALANSEGHYKNMVEARFTAVGVGVFLDDTGQLWTVHIFGG